MASVHLDTFRGIAALAVAVFHVRNLFLVDYPSVTDPSLAIKALYFVSGLGHQAVIVFFVLSGFLISSSVIESRRSALWQWRAYLVARLSRLMTVLLLALVLGALLDQGGMALFGLDGVYGANPALGGNVISTPVAESSTLLIGVGNALFLQGIVVPTFGTNGALWSLSYEFWYYILFPLGLAIFWPSVSKLGRAVSLVTSIAILIFVGQNIALYSVIWLMGALPNIVPRSRMLSISRTRVTMANIAAACLVVACLFAIKASVLTDGVQADFVLGALFTLLVYTTLHSADRTPDSGPRAYVRAAHLGAGFSYTLYAVHIPLLVFVQAGVLSVARWQPSAGSLALGFVLLAAVVAYAFLLSRVTEARTSDARRLMMSVTARVQAKLLAGRLAAWRPRASASRRGLATGRDDR